MATIPIQRAIRVMTTTYTWSRDWFHEATPLERAGVAQYAYEALWAKGPLSPLEAFVAARESVLAVSQNLHPAPTVAAHNPRSVLHAWLQWLAQDRKPMLHLELPDLDSPSL